MTIEMGDKNIQQVQPNMVEVSNVTSESKTPPPTSMQKLESKGKTVEAQKNKPSFFNSEAVKFVQKASGFSLITIGFSGMVLLSPITIPLGLLGAGMGLALGKAIGYEKAGMFAGQAIGTLLFSGVAFLGALLVENARNRNSSENRVNENKVSGSKMEAPAKKLNEAESKFLDRINFFRNMSREGNNTETEIQNKKVQLTNELKEGKEFSKEFKKSALIQLKEFDGDFAKGQIAKSENLNKAFSLMMEKNDISIKFYTFVNDLPKNSEMEAKIPDTTKTINEIKELQAKAKATLEDKNIDVTTKTASIYSDRGHLRSDAQFFILDDLKTILSSGKTPPQQKEVNSSIDVIKRHLTHQLAEGKVAPTEAEVTEAYNTLKKYATEEKNLKQK